MLLESTKVFSQVVEVWHTLLFQQAGQNTGVKEAPGMAVTLLSFGKRTAKTIPKKSCWFESNLANFLLVKHTLNNQSHEIVKRSEAKN